MLYRKIPHKDYTVILEDDEIYVDNESRRRSGHMSHAMAEFAPGCLIDFYSNCSAVRLYGHMPYGWVEYRISRDAGKTWSKARELSYSKESFLDGIHAISVEKAVATDNGTIVAFCLRNDAMDPGYCEPWSTPTVILSTDEGETWSEPRECIPYAGRIYDALYYKGTIYAMIFCSEYHVGTLPEHVYRIYKSTDNGASFEELCVVPLEGIGHAYCSMLFDEDDVLHAYAYNDNCEEELDHAISRDFGRTWECTEPCHLPLGIRNPQTALIDGVYILHGRNGGKVDSKGFVLYTSTDAAHWDEGTLIRETEYAYGSYYSNNLNLRDEKGNFLLIQYSERYGTWGQVNVKHMKLRIQKSNPAVCSNALRSSVSS